MMRKDLKLTNITHVTIFRCADIFKKFRKSIDTNVHKISFKSDRFHISL